MKSSNLASSQGPIKYTDLKKIISKAAPKFPCRAIWFSHRNCVNLYVYNFAYACFMFSSLSLLSL